MRDTQRRKIKVGLLRVFEAIKSSCVDVYVVCYVVDHVYLVTGFSFSSPYSSSSSSPSLLQLLSC